MSKLHFYRSVPSIPTKVAEGDGTMAASGFDAAITEGSVEKGIVYEVSRGQDTGRECYNCTRGAEKNDMASFTKASDGVSVQVHEAFYGAAIALRNAVRASEKNVMIEIDTADLRTLKRTGYKLCFAKKIAESDYNVVWQAYDNYLVNNQFSWTPQFQLFGSSMFKVSEKVRISTNLVNIGPAEESVLDDAGVLCDPKPGGPPTAITLINNYGSIRPGINQLSTGLDGSQVSTPIFVAQEAIPKGEASMTPVEKVLVWFEQEVETSTMFCTVRYDSVEIDLTDTNQATRLFKDRKWSTP